MLAACIIYDAAEPLDDLLTIEEMVISESAQPIPPGHENLIQHLVCDPCSEPIVFIGPGA
jgi:hypothetical protein